MAGVSADPSGAQPAPPGASAPPLSLVPDGRTFACWRRNIFVSWVLKMQVSA